MGRNIPWSPEETSKFIFSYPSTKNIEQLLLLFPGRTHPALRHKASRLGLRLEYLRRPPKPFPKRTITLPNDPAKLAYLAALIDGEGWIALRPHKRIGKYGQKSPIMRVCVCNTFFPVLQWCKRHFKGAIDKRKPVMDKRGIHGRKPMYIWSCTGIKNCHDLLITLDPYLVIKRTRARAVTKKLNLLLSNIFRATPQVR